MNIIIDPALWDTHIVLQRGALHRAGQLLQLDRRALIVTDDGVPADYAAAVAAQCSDPIIVTLPQGEATKCIARWQQLLCRMLQAGFTRQDCVVAVGGGVVGDLSGFAAACYQRGVDFYSIPTTLLSQVDSSVGGKTAVDLDGVKNAVGAFYPAQRVLIDPDTLDTLDVRQLHAGLAEAIKMAVTCDAVLFSRIEQSRSLPDDLPEIITRSLRIKMAVVRQDPKESGLRRVLNFGHTLGHAVESFCQGRLLHGECVALGMLPMCSPSVRARLAPVLERYGLPTHITQQADELLPYLLHDKKMQDGRVTAVLCDEPGTFRFAALSPEELLHRMEALS